VVREEEEEEEAVRTPGSSAPAPPREVQAPAPLLAAGLPALFPAEPASFARLALVGQLRMLQPIGTPVLGRLA